MAAAPLVSPAKWSALNSTNMLKARSLCSNMLRNVHENEAIERASKHASMEQVEREKQQKRDDVFAKAAAHNGIIGSSSKCTADIEEGLLQASNSLALLRQNRALGFAALQVCKRRRQLRNRRPKPEMVKDYVSIALESEQKLLEVAREEYLQLEEQGKRLSEDLAKFRAHLSEDTGSRRLIMKKDQQSLRPHLAPPPEMQRPAPVIEEENSASLLEDTFALIDRSNKHREQSLAAVKRIKEESAQALFRSESCLEKRTDELVALELELKAHMKEADAAISTAERSLDKSQKRLDPNDKDKADKLSKDNALLSQLKAHRERLHTEIQNKFIALEIDNMCRRVTPVKACEPSLMDQNNAAEGNTQQNFKKAGHLTNSSSAPNLLSQAGFNNVGGSKLPALGGTMTNFRKDQFGNTSPQYSAGSMASKDSYVSSTSSGAKVKQ